MALSSPLFSTLDAQSENVEENADEIIGFEELVSERGIIPTGGVVGISDWTCSVLSRSVNPSSESDSTVTGLGLGDAAFGISEAQCCFCRDFLDGPRVEELRRV